MILLGGHGGALSSRSLRSSPFKSLGGGLIDRNAADGRRPAGLRVHVDDRAVETNVAGGDVVMRGPEGPGGLHHAVDPPAEDALVRAGHADVALEGRPAGKNLFVGRGHVGVGAQHGADAPVQVPAHQLLVAGGLGVEVDQDHADLGRQRGQHPVGRLEGAIDRRHEHPAQKHEDRHGNLLPGPQDHYVASRGGGRIVRRPHDPAIRLQDRRKSRAVERHDRPG